MTSKKSMPEENLYYLLATVYGEQGDKNNFDGTYEDKNRRIWNAVMGQWLTNRSKKALANDLCIDVGEFSELTQHEILAIERRLSGTEFSINDIPDENTTQLFHVIQFRDIHFPTGLLLQKRVFPTTVTFTNCIFSGNVSFSNSVFSSAHFKRCEFQKKAYFRNSKIGVLGWISNACNFTECIFFGHCEFSEAQLKSADFTKSAFKTAAHFEDTMFYSGCPKFFETELPEDTLFTLQDENWGLPFARLKKDGQLEDYTKADIDRESVKYAALRKRMESIQRPVEAGFFIRKELSLRSNLKGWDALLIKLYGFLSGYGHSIQRPLFWLIFTMAIGSSIYAGYFSFLEMNERISGNPVLSGVGLSLSATFSFLGLGRLFFSDILSEVPPVLAAVYGLQSFSGFLFSFLLGLGVRSQLRLK